ncbi:MAG: hypothetical protein Q8M98_02785 [Candidatus Cloacimonadaceae bacterium]|nr:hypothetical protein [Candidatus Cloacimonadaceae bacterium]
MDDANHLMINNVKQLEDSGINLDITRYQEDIMRDTPIEVEVFDQTQGTVNAQSQIALNIAGNDLQALFEQVVASHLGSFSSIKRSAPIVKTAIYSWFRKYLGTRDWREEFTLIQIIFLYKQNKAIFEHILSKTVVSYKDVRQKEVKSRIEKSELRYNFDILPVAFFNQHTDERKNQRKYVYDPCYLGVSRSQPEKNFETLLDDNFAKIVWWWKNGKSKKDYFGIKYEYPNGVIHTFYPDYIVKFNDGRLGIFEIKDVGDRDGFTYTKAKAEILFKYIDDQNDKTHFGGIVIMVNNDWMINYKAKYDWHRCENSDWSDWELLSFVKG